MRISEANLNDGDNVLMWEPIYGKLEMPHLWFGKRCIQIAQWLQGFEYPLVYHVMGVVDATQGLCFEFSIPKARYVQDPEIQPNWIITRHKELAFDSDSSRVLRESCDDSEGTPYDGLELLVYPTGWRWLQFSRRWWVCSSGWIRKLEEALKRWIFGKKKRAYPADLGDSRWFKIIMKGTTHVST